MKRILLILLLFFVSTAEFSAQRDTEHWIAPYYESSSNTGRSLYLSTDSVTPFVVTIYNNNVAIGTETISKGTPKIFPVQKQYIATNTVSDAFNVRTFGLHLVGTSPFYCTLRLANGTSHAEILTSKGRAGIGNEFYVANTPSIYNSSSNNFTAGVLATEDNTTVTATWNTTPAPIFIGGNPPTNSQTFTLNKGQSFIFAGTGANSTNISSFIGAKIVSDKPITLTNGNNNGNFGSGGSTGSDIIMDQSVPVEKLGNTFAMVRTRSTSADLEGAIVVATENNTEIYINGAGVPIATINAGQHYRIPGTSYVLQGGQHYNMFISTTKNVYLYQLVSVEDVNNTGGFNYIPPLNCYLPRKIDEIGFVNQMPTASGGGSQVYTGTEIKLNILTEAGAVVTVNNLPINPADGPYPVTGNANWVTYGIEPVVGNLTIESTKAVTAGINGGFSTSGYGGYFAGFSNIPLISKQTGVCVPGIILEVDAGYLTYQWNLNGVPIPGATFNTYTPTIGGNYTCDITAGTCAPVITPSFKVFTCLTETTVSAVACAAVNIIPTFTNSTQTVVPSTITIITPPANGTAVIDPVTGLITYTPNAGYIGVDTMVYKFCGNEPEFVDCEQVTVNFEVPTYPTVQNVTLTECYIVTDPTTGLFDLTSAAVSPTAGVTYQYYPGLADAQNGTNEIFNFVNYIAPNSEVYVKVSNAGGCFKIAKITLVVTPPNYSTVLKDKYICVEGRTTLDAGPGFDSYVWSTGEITPEISNVSVGEYWVDLETDNCITRQKVKVFAVPDPVVNSVEITNNTATLTVIGGNPPYQYSIDNINFQDSNVFTDLPRGQNTFYVKDSYNCIPVSVEVTVPNLVNAITPNGDSVNDYVDYSELAYKKNLVFTVYDRYGNKIHTSDINSGYKWGGTFNDRKIITGTYWYNITWDQPDAKSAKNAQITYNGWILVKNRD